MTLSRLLRTVATLAIGATLTGCMTARIEQERQAGTGINTGESIVIMARSYHNGNETEERFVNCVDQRLAKRSTGYNILSDEDFVDAFYPWFEPRTAPVSTEELPRLLSRPGVSQRIAEQGVRYLVWLEGSTETLDGGGGISCTVGAGGGGCFGLTWFEKESDYEATVWDLSGSHTVGQVSADINGMSVIPAVVIPVPLIAPTQTTACKRLADQLESFITQSGA